MEIPRGSDGIERRYRAEGGGDLKNTGMCRQRGMTNFASRIAKGGIGKPAELDIEARFTPRPSEGIVRMALLTVREIGLGRLAVVVRIRPACRVPHLTMAEGAVEAAGFPRIVGGDDRDPQVCTNRMAEGANRGIYAVCIINSIGVSRGRIRPPGGR